MTIPIDQHITLEDGGRLLAEAVVHADRDHQILQATLHVESGHLPVGTRARLVDAILEESQAQPGTHLELALPAGDAEILDRIRQRCSQVETRPAGASCLVTGAV